VSVAVTFRRRRRAESAPAAGPQPPVAGSADSAVPSAVASAVPTVPAGADGGVVRGLVRTQDGWPLPDAAVTVLDAVGRQVGRTATDAAGAFETTVPHAGAATVIVAAPGHRPQARAADVPGNGACDLPTVELAREGGTVLPPPGRWVLDPEHSIVRATTRHLGLSRVEGRFRAFSGTVVVAEPIEASGVEVTIDAASIDTASADRDAHLRSPDFLDVERFPALTYRSTGLVRRDDQHWTLLGRLTIRDVTRDVPLDVTYVGTSPDPWGGTRMAFVATAELARADYEMNWNLGLPTGLGLVGPTLRVDLDLQAILQPLDGGTAE